MMPAYIGPLRKARSSSKIKNPSPLLPAIISAVVTRIRAMDKTYPQAGDDIGRGGRQDNLPEDPPAGQTKSSPGIDQGALDMPDTIDGIDQDRPGARVNRHRYDHRIADAEQEYRHRNDRHGRHRPEKLNRHRQQAVSHAKVTQADAEGHGDGCSEKIALKETRQGGEQVDRDLAGKNDFP